VCEFLGEGNKGKEILSLKKKQTKMEGKIQKHQLEDGTKDAVTMLEHLEWQKKRGEVPHQFGNGNGRLITDSAPEVKGRVIARKDHIDHNLRRKRFRLEKKQAVCLGWRLKKIEISSKRRS